MPISRSVLNFFSIINLCYFNDSSLWFQMKYVKKMTLWPWNLISQEPTRYRYTCWRPNFMMIWPDKPFLVWDEYHKQKWKHPQTNLLQIFTEILSNNDSPILHVVVFPSTWQPLFVNTGTCSGNERQGLSCPNLLPTWFCLANRRACQFRSQRHVWKCLVASRVWDSLDWRAYFANNGLLYQLRTIL